MIFANLEIICEKTTHFCIFFAQCAIKERNEQGPNVALLIIIFSIFYWWGKITGISPRRIPCALR